MGRVSAWFGVSLISPYLPSTYIAGLSSANRNPQ